MRRALCAQAAPSWAYIDDYLWYILMWLDAHRWQSDSRYLHEAADTFDLMNKWGTDKCGGGMNWMYPDHDPRKNAITTLEAVQAAAQLGVALKGHAPLRAHENRVRAMQLWRFFEDVQLLGADGLVHDNVTGTAHGSYYCCSSAVAPKCEVRDTITWTYNQGMLLGAVVDMHALTNNVTYLHIGAKVLDAVVHTLTTTARTTDDEQPSAAPTTVLREPARISLVVPNRRCDVDHDPSASAGGDLFSFKAVFMVQLPRFVEAAKAASVLTPTQLSAASKLVSDSSDAAWSNRVTPPFPDVDVCNEYRNPPPPVDAPPKFSWDWEPLPAGNALTCMDARTQSQALALFAAHHRIKQLLG